FVIPTEASPRSQSERRARGRVRAILVARHKRQRILATKPAKLPTDVTQPSCLPTRTHHCLSYTAVLLTFFPLASVPLITTVRVLPSAAIVILPVRVTFPSFLFVSANVRALTFLYDRVVAVESPVTG